MKNIACVKILISVMAKGYEVLYIGIIFAYKYLVNEAKKSQED
ncbi:hypothetical protein ABET51_01230 [Metabacillus fastidiosus]